MQIHSICKTVERESDRNIEDVNLISFFFPSSPKQFVYFSFQHLLLKFEILCLSLPSTSQSLIFDLPQFLSKL